MSASKTGFTPPSDVTRSLGVDLVEPSVTGRLSGSLQVGVHQRDEPDHHPDISSYSATGLPSGLGLNTATGVMRSPDSANASTQQATVTVTVGWQPRRRSIAFSGDDTLTGFQYGASTVTFGSPAPTVMAPTGAQTTVTYTSTPPNVCTVNTSTGALTIVGLGSCVITATAASSNNYNEATAMFTVKVQTQGPLALNLNTLVCDDTVNKKTAGVTISGESENGVSVSHGR